MESCDKLVARGGWAEDLTLKYCTFPIGPRNTVSNLSYAVIGAIVAAGWPSSASLAFALAMSFLAIGSALYHGFKTFKALQLDWAGMYAVFAAIAVHSMVPESKLAPWIMLVLAGALAYVYAYRLVGVHLEAQMGVLLVVSALRPALMGHWLDVLVSLGFFVLAMGVWLLDRRRSAITGLWGHAIWHVFTAIAFGTMFLAGIP